MENREESEMGGKRVISTTENLPNESSVSPEDIKVLQLTDEVFMNSLLLSIILGHVINISDEELCRSSIGSLNLVQKEWRKTIRQICTKRPLYKLELTKDNSVSNTEYVQNNGKLLDQFFKFLRTPKKGSLDNGTYSLKISEEVFRHENYPTLSTCLVQYGEKLVELELHIPFSGGSLKCIFPHFNFASLRKLIFLPTVTQVSDLSTNKHPGTDNVTHFLNSLLNCAKVLDEFIIPENSYTDAFSDFRYMKLPASLTNIGFGSKLTFAKLQVLTNSHLPKLTQLEMMVFDNINKLDLLFRLLEKFRVTLRQLTLNGEKYHEWLQYRALLRFPVMENLESFCTRSGFLELHPGSIGNLEKVLPKLKCLRLFNQTNEMFQKWCVSIHSSVNQVSLHLANDETGLECIGLSLENMQSVNRNFPNAHTLHLFTTAEEISGIRYVFEEMRHLKILKIEIKSIADGPDLWDTLLIGMPVKACKALRKIPEVWGEIQLKNQQYPSITNLTELKILSLRQWKIRHSYLNRDDPSISDLAFHFALMAMNKLSSLALSDTFVVSPEMSEMWKCQGRDLEIVS